VLQNIKDCTVTQPAGRNLRDAQLQLNGDATHNTPTKAQARQSACTPVFGPAYGCQQTIYTVDAQPTSRSLVETVVYDGPAATPDTSDTDHGHYWIGGADGRDGRWALQHGPSYPDIVWDFFSRHSSGPPPDVPVITLLGANPLQLLRGTAFSDPGATAQDLQDGAVPVQADCSQVQPNQNGSYACGYRATDSAGNTSTATRTVVVADATACKKASGAPGAHIAARRAGYGGFFNLRALASGDQVDIGFAFDYVFAKVTLYQREGSAWLTQPPAGCAT